MRRRQRQRQLPAQRGAGDSRLDVAQRKILARQCETARERHRRERRYLAAQRSDMACAIVARKAADGLSANGLAVVASSPR